jgi:hypothetical protein
VCAPTRDDDPRYSVGSYGTRKRTAEQAKAAHADTTGFAQAMARTDAAE